MLIDCSYFTKGSRLIVNATLGSNTAPTPAEIGVGLAIEGYIAEHQEDYLRAVLGDRLGNKANAYLVCLDEDADAMETVKRNGNLDTVLDMLREPFADYVFFHILRDSSEQATMTGLVRLKCANDYVSPITRQVDVWNRMVDRHRRFSEWSRTQECPLSGIDTKDEMVTRINRFNL